MKYTIIIPVYNGSATLKQCLHAVTTQKNAVLNRDYTVIVVDDGSTDNSVAIARKFPVSIIRLGRNKGRIIARLTGAKVAQTKKVLFVDSRVILPPVLIRNLEKVSNYQAVMGSSQDRAVKYRSFPDTIFFLLRRRYYGKNKYPQKVNLLEVNRKNFLRSPKGTTVLLIDRKLFIELTPERVDKTVNDDTLLFQQLVFKKNIPLYRSNDLLFNYLQRSDMKSFIPWLFERGIRFADFYLRPSGYFFIHFIFLFLFFSVILTVFFNLLFTNLFFVVFILIFIILINVLISLFLSENIYDFFISFIMFPCVFIIFGAGIIKYIFNSIYNKFHTEQFLFF